MLFQRLGHANHWTDSDVEAFWDDCASIYVEENEKVRDAHDQRFDMTLQYLSLIEGQKILNVTSRDCGLHMVLKRVQAGVSLVNAEISGRLMAVAARLHPDAIQVKLASYSRLPFESAEFDQVVSLETLEHVSDPVAFCEELHRVAKPGARLVLSCPSITSEIPYRVYTFLFGGHGEGPHRFLHSREVRSILERTGWRLLSHRGTLLMPVGPGWLKRTCEELIEKYQHTPLSELGIRQFYVCEKQSHT